MARKATPVKIPAKSAKIVSSTAVRNSPIPKVARATVAVRKPVTQEMVAFRAYEIASSGYGGSDQDNWFRAEQELHGR